jgi:hypothetical protein
LLRLDGVVELGEGVVILDEAETPPAHLAGEPFVAVDIDLDGERKPGLQAYVEQAEVDIEEVIIDRRQLSFRCSDN